MFLQPYHHVLDGGITITAEQASLFAKSVAEDFNPIHDPEAKRFCVPGDLLFALVLNQCGLSSQMAFTFEGMVGADVLLDFPVECDGTLSIGDRAGKTYMTVNREGETCRDPQLIEQLIRQYVLFSGQNFPHILVPLMEAQQVMINPDRPLVMYERMSLSLDRLTIRRPQLSLSDATLDVTGKRGVATLNFEVRDSGERVGSGAKRMLLSGLRPYQQAAIDGLVAAYEARKVDFQQLRQAA